MCTQSLTSARQSRCPLPSGPSCLNTRARDARLQRRVSVLACPAHAVSVPVAAARALRLERRASQGWAVSVRGGGCGQPESSGSGCSPRGYHISCCMPGDAVLLIDDPHMTNGSRRAVGGGRHRLAAQMSPTSSDAGRRTATPSFSRVRPSLGASSAISRPDFACQGSAL